MFLESLKNELEKTIAEGEQFLNNHRTDFRYDTRSQQDQADELVLRWDTWKKQALELVKDVLNEIDPNIPIRKSTTYTDIEHSEIDDDPESTYIYVIEFRDSTRVILSSLKTILSKLKRYQKKIKNTENENTKDDDMMKQKMSDTTENTINTKNKSENEHDFYSFNLGFIKGKIPKEGVNYFLTGLLIGLLIGLGINNI